MDMIVGSAIIPSMMEPASAVCPVGRSKLVCRYGTSTTSPKNPYTTEGMPASISTIGFRVFRIFISAISERYIAEATPRGTANRIAPAVTIMEPAKRGTSPNCAGSLVGYHFVPVKNSSGEKSPNSRIPSLNRNRQIRAVSYTHLRAHETRHDLVCRLLLEKKKKK